MSKVIALYHIVFCTKHREMTLEDAYREDVYRFMWNELKRHRCDLLRIGGIANHIHMLINLNPGESLSALMRDLKANSSGWLQLDGRFPRFQGWAREYYAGTISVEQKSVVINYINGQQTHHGVTSLNDELRQLHQQAGLTYDARDMTE